MLAVTSDKALLRAVWELVEKKGGRATVRLAEATDHLRARGKSPADPDALELDARLLQELGFVKLNGRNGSREVELTQVGAFLATRLTL